NHLGVVAARIAWSHAQRSGCFLARFDFLARLADGPANGAQRCHLAVRGILARLLAFPSVLALVLLQGRELLGERTGRDYRGGSLENRAFMEGVIVRRLQQLNQELSSRWIDTVLLQFGVGLKCRPMKISEGILVEPGLLGSLAFVEHLAATPQAPLI